MNSIRKQYEPIMSKRKMRKLNTITAKNYRRVCGEINRFLQNDVVVLSDIRKKAIQFNKENRPANIQDMFTEETYAIYHPYFGICIDTTDEEEDYKGMRIESKYDLDIIDIRIGDRYKIFGDRLVIQITRCPMNDVEHCYPGYHEFIRVNHSSEEEMIQYKCASLEMVLWNDYELFQMVNPYVKQVAAENAFEVTTLSQTIVDAMENLCLEQNDPGEHKITINISKNECFDIIVDVQDFLDQKTPLNLFFKWKRDGYEFESPHFMGFLEDFPRPMEEHEYRDEDGQMQVEYVLM